MKTHDERMHELLYSNDGRVEQCERICKLEELVKELFRCATRGAACEKCKENNDGYACAYIMRELGIEVES